MKQIVETLSKLTNYLQEGLDLATVEIPILNDCEDQVEELAKELAESTIMSYQDWLLHLNKYFEAKNKREKWLFNLNNYSEDKDKTNKKIMLSKRPSIILDTDLSPVLEEVSYFFRNSKRPTTEKHKYYSLKPKHPRNAPCSCGSGKKFKKCCNI
jgi:uncharacterized protein YecA (UPF0149 family)